MRPSRLMFSLALISSLANLAAADDFQDRAFDTVSGRDIRNFPPDPQVKFNHLKLDLRMEKPESKSFTCTETITFTTLGRPLGWLDLDAKDLKITSVKDSAGGGGALDFRYDGEKLTIRFPKELAPVTDAGVQIEYECHDPKGGMIFALPDAAYKDRPVIIHTQGEAEQSRNWFICHDSPNARFTTETLVTVPAKYLVVGNGKLVEKKDLAGGLVQYHHLMEQPHSAYLTSLVIGDLAVVTDQWRGRPVEYYAPKSMEPDLRRTFGKTPKMIELFSQLTGVDYPYAKYAQSVVWLFGAGGMENISATTLLETSVHDERRLLDSDSESLISHELAHQWFGDMVTCKSWQHLWLNEGFATFMAWVWAEHEQGPDEYTCQIYNTFRGIAESDSVDLSSGVVWPFYADPEETFGRPGSNPYPKGGSAIHMLRRSLGDELFWKCIGEYLRRYQWKTAETDDLRKVVDELSGRSYEQFFHQWLYRPGVPLIKVGYEWNEGAKEVRLTLEQIQKITKDAPVFEADVDVWLVMPDGTVTKHIAHMDTKTTGLTIKCDKEPTQVCIDPSISLLTQFDLKLPEPMLVRGLKEGPTVGTRLHALHELQEKDSDAAREAMKIVLLDEKASQGLRREVATSLGRNQQDGARQILLDSLAPAPGKAIVDPKVRAAALRALGSYKNADAAATLLRYARSDPAYGVEAAATTGLGKQKSTDEIITALLANTKKTGAADQIRIAAVGALAALEEPRGLDAAFELAAYGQPFRSRPPGIRALAQLGKKDDVTSKKVREFLETLLDDPQSQSLEAAISALGTLSDPAAIPALEKFASGSATSAERQSARRAIDAINRKSGDPAIFSDLRTRIEKLEKEREDMEKKLQKLNKNQ